MFNTEKAIRDSGLSQEIIETIIREVREEFPDDDMMYELHLLRAIDSERDKDLSPAEKAQKMRLEMDRILSELGYDIVSSNEGKKRIVKI